MSSSKQLELILLEGEGYQVEFKEAVSSKLDREIVAFANASGGSIFIGVNDEGKVKGTDLSGRLKSRIVDIARNCDPSIKIEWITYDNEKVLEIKVAEGTDKPYRCHSGFFLRVGPSTQKLKRDEIIDFISHSTKLHFDESINEKFQYPKDFSKEYFNDYLKLCDITKKFSQKDVLLSLNVAEENKNTLLFTNAGILFFAKEPQRFLPESYITAVRYKTQDRSVIIDKKDFYGPIFLQIDEVLKFIQRNIEVEYRIGENSLGRRKETYTYPLIALREALINAVAHRDYVYDLAHTMVQIYSDRIEIENPGGLLHGLTLKNLRKRSVRRNRLITDFLDRSNYIERVGSGFDRMSMALKENGNPELIVKANNFFNILFYKRLEKVSPSQLTERQLEIHRILEAYQTSTTRDIALRLNVSNDTALREISDMIKKDIVVKQGIGKQTKYILK